MIKKKYSCTYTARKGRANYLVVIRWYDEKGKRQRKTITTNIAVKGDTKRKIKIETARIEDEWNNKGEYVISAQEQLFSKFYQEWMENKKPSVTAVTYDGYKIIADTHIIPYFSERKIRVVDVDMEVLEDYINVKRKSGISDNTIRKHIVNLKQALDRAVRLNILPYNPTDRIEKPKYTEFQGYVALKQAEIESLLQAIKGDCLEPVIMFALFYGLRRSEVLGLRWSSVSLEEKLLTVEHTIVKISKTTHRNDRTKNNLKRSYTIPDSLIACLKKIKSEQEQNRKENLASYVDEGYIFTDKLGRVWKPNYVTAHFKRLQKWHNLTPMRFHDLRRTMGTILLDMGIDIREVQAYLGHKHISTTMKYTHPGIESKERIGSTLQSNIQGFVL